MVKRKTILIVSEAQLLKQVLVDQLQKQGEYLLEESLSVTDAISLIVKEHFDCLLIDFSVADVSPRNLCKNTRSEGVRSPIILITGEQGEDTAISALDSGANDYINKPFKFSVLLARVRSHLRSFEQSEDAIFQVRRGDGDFCRRALRCRRDPVKAPHVLTRARAAGRTWEPSQRNSKSCWRDQRARMSSGPSKRFTMPS